MTKIIYRGGNIINLLGRYYDPILVEQWLNNHEYPSSEVIIDIFYKAARDFRDKKIDIDEFSGICDILYFDTYLQSRERTETYDLDERIKTAMLKFSDPYGEEADDKWRLKEKFWNKYLGFVK